MSNESIKNELLDQVNRRTAPERMSKSDAKEVLEMLFSDIQCQIDALDEEMENEDDEHEDGY